MIDAKNEVFVPVEGYKGQYEVSNRGRVCSYASGKPFYLKQWKRFRNYMCVGLSQNSKVKFISVHRLVAKAFISNPKNKPCVNHKDRDPTNNHVDNLEWVTHAENEQHAYANGKVIWNKGKGKFSVRICENCGIEYKQYYFSGKRFHNWICYLEGTGRKQLARIEKRIV